MLISLNYEIWHSVIWYTKEIWPRISFAVEKIHSRILIILTNQCKVVHQTDWVVWFSRETRQFQLKSVNFLKIIDFFFQKNKLLSNEDLWSFRSIQKSYFFIFYLKSTVWFFRGIIRFSLTSKWSLIQIETDFVWLGSVFSKQVSELPTWWMIVQVRWAWRGCVCVTLAGRSKIYC